MKIQHVELNSKDSRSLYYERNFKFVMDYQWLLLGVPAYRDMKDYFEITRQGNVPWFIFMDSNLHKTLNQIVPTQKQNAQISGKYKKARLYLFETSSFYIAAACETGDRGSQWLFLDKENYEPRAGYSSGNEVLMLEYAKARELSEFFRHMAFELIEKNPEYESENSSEFINALKKEFETHKKIKP